MEYQRIGQAGQLYLNLACKPFTFILGSSRVDMTAFVKQFAAHFGATAENGRYFRLQVRPDFMDSSDLFGWLNLEGKFVPGAVMDFLKAANDDPENEYFLCLDRIVLSRAEYYLRDVFNAIDSRAGEEEKPYVPAVYYGRDGMAAEKYGVIPVLSNLFMIGTVNLDETSLPLNQRLLDRVHTLCMEDGDAPQIPETLPKKVSAACCRRDQWPEDPVMDEYMECFESINKMLIKASSYLGFVVRNEGISYLLHNRRIGLLPETVAMDQVICEKILPRLQGNTGRIGPVLQELQTFCGKGGYKKAARKISLMLARSKESGYCSFWS